LEVQRRIVRACARAGRDPAEVKLIAVTKGRDVPEIQRAILAHGHRVLGESRIQEWRGKLGALEGAEWHFIGNLQTNKVKYCGPFHTVHALNSVRLADALEQEGRKKDHRFRVMVEVNVAGEANKQGVALEGAEALVRYAQRLPHLDVAGLMTIAPYTDDPEAARPVFRALRELRDRLALKELSMGMSGDFEVAVEEGATNVRIGSALFGAPEREARAAPQETTPQETP
jgi:pyridoxal phosphate enzyme (YggS family)